MFFNCRPNQMSDQHLLTGQDKGFTTHIYWGLFIINHNLGIPQTKLRISWKIGCFFFHLDFLEKLYEGLLEESIMLIGLRSHKFQVSQVQHHPVLNLISSLSGLPPYP